jgi:hypothetical protein
MYAIRLLPGRPVVRVPVQGGARDANGDQLLPTGCISCRLYTSLTGIHSSSVPLESAAPMGARAAAPGGPARAVRSIQELCGWTFAEAMAFHKDDTRNPRTNTVITRSSAIYKSLQKACDLWGLRAALADPGDPAGSRDPADEERETEAPAAGALDEGPDALAERPSRRPRVRFENMYSLPREHLLHQLPSEVGVMTRETVVQHLADFLDALQSVEQRATILRVERVRHRGRRGVLFDGSWDHHPVILKVYDSDTRAAREFQILHRLDQLPVGAHVAKPVACGGHVVVTTVITHQHTLAHYGLHSGQLRQLVHDLHQALPDVDLAATFAHLHHLVYSPTLGWCAVDFADAATECAQPTPERDNLRALAARLVSEGRTPPPGLQIA